ncbi:MAG: hypothetical protein PHU06_12550 [Gallionella sp.]|nr:hypothetical protein [Gallionella sp.]MDD4959429.1 hypothetical protein [Gallionella sp.]
MLSIIVSTLAFFVAAWYLNRYLNEQEIAEGMTRRILVIVLASVVSFVVGVGVDSLVGDPESAPSMALLPTVPSQSE